MLTCLQSHVWVTLNHTHTSHTSQGPSPCTCEGLDSLIQRPYWMSTALDFDMDCWNFCHAYSLELDVPQIPVDPYNVIHKLSRRNPYRLFICSNRFGPSNLLPSSVKLPWIVSTFRLLRDLRMQCSHAFKATSYTRLKALDHGNLRALIGRKGRDRPSSHHTRRWRSKGPKKSLWMKSLHGVLHGGLWIRVHGLPKFASGPPPRGGSDENSGKPWFFNISSNMTDFRTYCIANSRTYSRSEKHHQIILLIW